MIPVTRNDLIYVDWISPSRSLGITVTAIIQLIDGKITKYERNFLITAGNVSQINSFRLTSGVLISLNVRDTFRLIDWGQVHVTTGITRTEPDASTSNQPNLLQLATGYISRSHQISFPVGSNEPILKGQGLHGIEKIDEPAQGAELTFTTPANQLNRFYGIRFTFQTSAQVASRRVNFNIRLSADTIYTTAADSAQTASRTFNYNFFSGINEQPLNDNVHVQSAPLIMLPKGTTIETLTTNIQTEDQFRVGVLLLETFITTD